MKPKIPLFYAGFLRSEVVRRTGIEPEFLGLKSPGVEGRKWAINLQDTGVISNRIEIKECLTDLG